MRSSWVGDFNLKSSIFWKTYLFNLILLFITLAICFESARLILPAVAQENRKEITDATVDRLANQASFISAELQNLEVLIKNDPIFLSNDPSLVTAKLENVVKYSPLVDNAALFNKQGNLISMYPTDIGDLRNVSFRSYFLNPLISGNSYLSEVIVTNNGVPALVLGIPLRNAQLEVENIIALRIELKGNRMVESLFTHFDIGSNGYSYIVDGNGRVLFHPQKDKIAEDFRQNVLVADLIDGKSGYKRLTELQGEEMLASYRYIPYLQWGVVAQVPVESTYYSLKALEKTVEEYALLVLFPLLFIVAFYSHHTIQPVKKLQRAVHEVMDGNYDYHIPTDGKTEIGILFQYFNQMVGKIRVNKRNLKEKQQELLEQKLFLRQILDLDPNYIHARDRNGKYTLVNQAKLKLFGFSVQDEMIGKSELEVNPDQQIAYKCLQQDERAFNEESGFFVPEYSIVDNEGKTHWIQVHKIPLKNTDHKVEHVLSIATDITERKQKEREIEYLAYHDSLTGLPNRFCLERHVTRSIEEEPNQLKAILFFDLDHFKLINDSLGHAYGDRIIKMVGDRLQDCVPKNACVTRMGGDEFTILLANLEDENDARKVGQTILERLKPSFKLEDMEFHVTASIGISLYPKDGDEYEDLLKKADTAMYQAKKAGKNMYFVFEPKMERSLWERLEMEASLRKALEFEELSLVYQPKFDLSTDEVCGMEALLRWQHPMYGAIPPDKFIPVIEENGLIITIGEWVLREACSQNKAWQEAGYKPLRMAVNLSVKQLLHSEFLSMIDQVLQDTNLDAQWLELEITESRIMENAGDVIPVLKAITERGISLSIDDFGTGYSSLSYLRQFPIHTIKVDRSFIKDSSQTEESQMIIRAILSMAKSLKLKVIAEGVEEEQQIEFLRREGCHEIQGYIISSPLKPDGFIQFLLKSPVGNLS